MNPENGPYGFNIMAAKSLLDDAIETQEWAKKIYLRRVSLNQATTGAKALMELCAEQKADHEKELEVWRHKHFEYMKTRTNAES